MAHDMYITNIGQWRFMKDPDTHHEQHFEGWDIRTLTKRDTPPWNCDIEVTQVTRARTSGGLGEI